MDSRASYTANSVDSQVPYTANYVNSKASHTANYVNFQAIYTANNVYFKLTYTAKNVNFAIYFDYRKREIANRQEKQLETRRTMLTRKAYQKLIDWKQKSKGTTALLIEGARRVGKSALVKEFGTNEYQSCLVVDFTYAPDDVISYFNDMRNDLNSFFLYLSAYYQVPLFERNTLIVFDEVQAFPKAREFIKQLVADGRYDYIETGSLVSIRKNVEDIQLPSEEHPMRLNPFDFEEFLWAMDEAPLSSALASSFINLKPLPASLHRKAMRLFREYMLVGGMPQAVQKYVQTRNFEAVDEIKRDILTLYRNDISKYAGTAVRRVTSIFDNIAGQLSKHEKRFNLASLGKNVRMRDSEDAFFWLSDAHITNNCFNSTDPSIGLKISEDQTTVKCYMADTGLLVTHALATSETTPESIYRDILLEKIGINEGMLTENIIAQQLRAHGHELFFFSSSNSKNVASSNSKDVIVGNSSGKDVASNNSSGKDVASNNSNGKDVTSSNSNGKNATGKMEIDFLIVAGYADAAMRARISPIEVKSTKRYSTASLDKFKTTYGKHVGTQYLLCPKELHVDGDLVTLPLYLACYL